MKRRLLLLFLIGMMTLTTWAQRTTDVLDRGLVAVKTSGGIFCSWRITAEEYYDVTYNIYRDGTKLNSTPLTVSNYTDKNGTTSSKYAVEAVVRGVAQAKCAAVTPWTNNYKEIKMNHGSLTSTFIPNDACMADVDGDGELEILLKFDNSSDANNRYMPGGFNGEYAIMEVYKLDGTKLWWLDFGPNMSDFQNNENNIVAYDWDGDGKAEAVMRAADGTTIHMSDGTTYVVGNKSKNYRNPNGSSGQWFIYQGDEFLLYLNGETGKPYQCLEYPLKRLESGQSNLSDVWGDGYGHRSSKHFFGAPYLDGRKPSIFLARGIYTQHKMIAYDVNPTTHELTERWRWNCKTSGSPWYGQGFHNYGVADVDWDGRDEIVFGSMVIDDNGKGLSTTGFGHGDAQHCGDLDPFSHGQEIFTCLEEKPANCFRDATTAKIYYRTIGSSDDGRAIMDNFINDIPGSQGTSAYDPNIICSASHAAAEGFSKSGSHIALNFRIYWDGDLCSESFNYADGKNTAGVILKPYVGTIATLTGSLTNNDTKGTPCYQGDVLGDWREEVVMRTADNNIRIYTTNVATPWRNYTLWHDHQYRNAMVWQMCGYNQPPHASYFLGELEGITRAPAPLTMTGRTEIKNGSTIGASSNDKHILMCEAADITVNVTDGATPYILTVNAPTWVQGHDDNNNITTTTYTHTLTGGAFAGSMRLVKQGDGVLNMPKVTETYTGPTEVWAGTLNFDGTLQSSRLWLNRFAQLNSNGGTFAKGIEMNYASVLRPGGQNAKGTVTTDSLILNYGAKVEFDLYASDFSADVLRVNVLKIDKKDWKNGPEYLSPVFNCIGHPADGQDRLTAGRYLIAEVGKIDGDINNIVVGRISGVKAVLVYEAGKLYIEVQGMRSAADVTWSGESGSVWDLAETENFTATDGTGDVFVDGDAVTFDDKAETGNVELAGELHPSSVVFNNNTLEYNISGGTIAGETGLVKKGSAKTTIANINSFSGGTQINEGTLEVSTLANNDGVDVGALGGPTAPVTINNGAKLLINASEMVKTTQPLSVGEGGAVIEVPSGATLAFDNAITSSSKAPLYKRGTGTLKICTGNTIGKIYLEQGTISCATVSSASQRLSRDTLVFNGAGVTLDHENSEGMGGGVLDYMNYLVPEGKSGKLYIDGRCDYYGGLAGSGQLSIYPRYVRAYFHGNWSAFTGTVRVCYNGTNTYGVNSMLLGSGANFSNATIYVEDQAILSNEGVSVAVRQIEGTGTLSGAGTYTIGGGNDDIYFKGTISSPVTKVGTGKWTVSKSYPQTGMGAVNINSGMLYLDTYYSSTSIIGSTVNINDGAEISGIGTVGTLVLNSGAEATPGIEVYNNTGFIKATSTFNAKAGSTINLSIYSNGSTNYSRSFVGSAQYMFMNGTVNVALHEKYVPAAGHSFTLWTAEQYVGNPTVNLPELPLGLKWDTSKLNAATGVLKIVADADGISAPRNAGIMHCRLYTTGGVLVGEFDASAAEMNAKARSLGVAAGAYILKTNSANGAKSVKIVVK